MVLLMMTSHSRLTFLKPGTKGFPRKKNNPVIYFFLLKCSVSKALCLLNINNNKLSISPTDTSAHGKLINNGNERWLYCTFNN